MDLDREWQQQPPAPARHTPDGEFVTFRGGPMDGYRMPVTGWTAESRREGVAHINLGPDPDHDGDARVLYGPPEDHPDPASATEWPFQGWIG